MPFFICVKTDSCCRADTSPTRHVTGTPSRVMCSTWSVMSDTRGITTTVSPERVRAGTWKISDLPPPVGRITKTSFRAITALIASSWNLRNPFLLPNTAALRPSSSSSQSHRSDECDTRVDADEDDALVWLSETERILGDWIRFRFASVCTNSGWVAGPTDITSSYESVTDGRRLSLRSSRLNEAKSGTKSFVIMGN